MDAVRTIRDLGIDDRGRIAPGYHADLAIFDPSRVRDVATFEAPHAYAAGMVHVFVNGQPVLRHGEHTGALPGRIVRGPGWKATMLSDRPAAAGSRPGR